MMPAETIRTTLTIKIQFHVTKKASQWTCALSEALLPNIRINVSQHPTEWTETEHSTVQKLCQQPSRSHVTFTWQLKNSQEYTLNKYQCIPAHGQSLHVNVICGNCANYFNLNILRRFWVSSKKVQWCSFSLSWWWHLSGAIISHDNHPIM